MYHDNSCCRDKVNRAAGQRAVVMVFATSLRQFYHDGTIPANLSGQRHLDNFIMTRKLSSIYQDYAKTHANPDTDGNCPYHRAVRLHSGCEPTPCPLKQIHHDILLASSYRDSVITQFYLDMSGLSNATCK